MDIVPESFLKLNIVYEDENLAVIDKPAGLLVHSAPKIKEKTLVDFLVERYPEIKKVGDEPELRPGIVHRLDKDTSGLMVVAKNQPTFEFLKRQFQERKVEKRYLALVYGRVVKDENQIILPIGKSRKFGRQAVGFKAKNIRPALTEFKVVKRFSAPIGDFTLLEVYPKTGRTHQIRTHLAAIGHPIVGDRLYRKNKSSEADLDRQFLHAYFLKFESPGKKILQFRSELPEGLKNYLATIASDFLKWYNIFERRHFYAFKNKTNLSISFFLLNEENLRFPDFNISAPQSAAWIFVFELNLSFYKSLRVNENKIISIRLLDDRPTGEWR